MRFKNRDVARTGFSLIEVLLALAVMGTVLTSALILENTVLKRVAFSTARLDRVFIIRNLFFDASMKVAGGAKRDEGIKKHHDNPPMDLEFVDREPREKSALKKLYGMHVQQATGSWKTFGFAQEMRIVKLAYVPPAPKEKKR